MQKCFSFSGWISAVESLIAGFLGEGRGGGAGGQESLKTFPRIWNY